MLRTSLIEYLSLKVNMRGLVEMPKPLKPWQIYLVIAAGCVGGLFAAAGTVGPASVLPYGRIEAVIIFYLIIGTVAGGAGSWATVRQ
jgi:hypothetical protein